MQLDKPEGTGWVSITQAITIMGRAIPSGMAVRRGISGREAARKRKNSIKLCIFKRVDDRTRGIKEVGWQTIDNWQHRGLIERRDGYIRLARLRAKGRKISPWGSALYDYLLAEIGWDADEKLISSTSNYEELQERLAR